MPSSYASCTTPGRSWVLFGATRRPFRAGSAFEVVLSILALVSALFVSHLVTASFSLVTRHAVSPSPVEPDPQVTAPPKVETEAADSSDRRLDVPLSASPDTLDDAPTVFGSDVELVSYTTAGDLPARAMSHDEFAAHAPRLLDLLPTLDRLQSDMPAVVFTDDIERQKDHIRTLDETAEVTREGFDAFVVDRRYRASVPTGEALDRIDPRMFIIHWTGGGYEDVDHFLRVMGSLRVQYFIDRQARVYELLADHEKPAHVLGANDFTQGVEIETGHFDEVNSPLYGYTADQITQTVYLAVDFLRRNDLPVDRTTIVGHFAADLIFSNPYYDPHTGTFSQGRIRKFDPPEELMAVIVNKARALDRALSREHGTKARSVTLDQVPNRDPATKTPAAANNSKPRPTKAQGRQR
ncbi:MAG: peptidoglycan recognition family protein [Nitriliruptoraceae bacterium]